MYHIFSSLSSAFSNFFGAFQLQTFESRTLIQPPAALAANFYMILCSLRFVKYFFHLVVSRQARPGRCTLLLSRSLARACLYYHSVLLLSTCFFIFLHFVFLSSFSLAVAEKYPLVRPFPAQILHVSAAVCSLQAIQVSAVWAPQCVGFSLLALLLHSGLVPLCCVSATKQPQLRRLYSWMHCLQGFAAAWQLPASCLFLRPKPVRRSLPATRGYMLPPAAAKKEAADIMSAAYFFVLALPIFPGRRQPSIFGAGELNCRVRDGNGWTLTAINTNSLFFEKKSKQKKLPFSSPYRSFQR